jgi:hypothetical protein
MTYRSLHRISILTLFSVSIFAIAQVSQLLLDLFVLPDYLFTTQFKFTLSEPVIGISARSVLRK